MIIRNLWIIWKKRDDIERKEDIFYYNKGNNNKKNKKNKKRQFSFGKNYCEIGYELL